ncbi:MAG: MarR family transcriptional regulator [Treponema sp.]|jgi:DNA-binding MarR family transcriptional regulator|nr:MarR family transcriptional regulator [Treponema sp.]
MFNTIDSEYRILENIYDAPVQPFRQRDLAHIAGISLGMTNSILKRLAKKGWISIKKLNSRTIQYAITPEGINEVIRRSYRYFKRTIRNVVFYKDKIEEALCQARDKNTGAVFLIGKSDLEFIVEHGCSLCGLRLLKFSDEETARAALFENVLMVYSENVTCPGPESGKNTLYLSEIALHQRSAYGNQAG